MLLNLKKELDNRNISYKQLGLLLDISEKTVYLKINEKTEFTLWEIKKIQTFLFPQYNFQYLFATDKSA